MNIGNLYHIVGVLLALLFLMCIHHLPMHITKKGIYTLLVILGLIFWWVMASYIVVRKDVFYTNGFEKKIVDTIIDNDGIAHRKRLVIYYNRHIYMIDDREDQQWYFDHFTKIPVIKKYGLFGDLISDEMNCEQQIHGFTKLK